MSLSKKELLKISKQHALAQHKDFYAADCEHIKFLLKNCRISIPKENRFFVSVNCANLRILAARLRAKHLLTPELKQKNLILGDKREAFFGYLDFGHTNAIWEDIIPLGIFGLYQRLLEYKNKNTDASKNEFFSQSVLVFEEVFEFMRRAAHEAEKRGKSQMAEGILNLTRRAPQNLFEAMQTSIIYYSLQQYFDGTILRTLGRLDALFAPYYDGESEYNDKLFADYILEVNSFKANSNIPFAICGSDSQGNDKTNALSYKLLKTYLSLNTADTKLHILCNKKTPDDIITLALDGIRNGKNSIVFMGDEEVIASLKKLGCEHEDAVNYHIVGCYECGANQEVTCSCNAKVNLPRALEYALFDGMDLLAKKRIGLQTGKDFNSFDELFEAFKVQTKFLCDCAMESTRVYERAYDNLHASPVFSATFLSALEKGADVYCAQGAKYNNSSLNAVGLATATDSLYAIKKLVFDQKRLTLAQLRKILRNNWQGEEALRLTVKNKFAKFGTNEEETDALAKSIIDFVYDFVDATPNARGGKFRLGLFSIDWRWAMGKKTAASADGRFFGETLSQNATATFGADKEGATAHLASVAFLDATRTPNAAIVDIDFHSSSVSGQNGLAAMLAAVKTFFALGGFAVHINVLDTKILKKAKERPQDYPNLQVRLCGWNVLFSTLSEEEKDEFIARSCKE